MNGRDLREWLRAARWRLGKVLRIGRWEVTKNAGGVDRRTALVTVVALVAIVAVAPTAVSGGVALDRGIYRVAVSQDSPYYGPAATDPTFAVVSPDSSAVDRRQVELLVEDDRIGAAKSRKGRAAYAEFRDTITRYNDRQMAREGNATAAFPVSVTLRYAERDRIQIAAGGGSGDGGGGDGGNGSGGGGGGDDGGGDGGGGSDGTDGGSDDGGGSGIGDVFGGDGLTPQSTSGSPADISPPFPFGSLVLAFLFVVPLNFIIQAYGSTILGERINRRGELLLVSPVSPVDIVAGKTLPYFAGAMGTAAVIAAAIGGGPLSVFALAPLSLLFLAATFLGAMFARSFKELTFVTVTVTVSLTTYAFVPAIFADVGAVALISPLTLVVRDLQGTAVGVGEVAFSTLPPALSAAVLFALGTGIYREEDMFTQRPIPLKALDALAARIAGGWSVAALSALLLPFVFVAELLAVAALFALPTGPSVLAILVGVAVIEELAKSVHVYAGYAHARFERGLVTALTIGAFSGLGFFVGEKLTLVAQLVGLDRLPEGQAALATGTGVPTLPAALALLVAPLLLHVVTAAVSATGASRGRSRYLMALTVAIGIHVAYNATVVVALG